MSLMTRIVNHARKAPPALVARIVLTTVLLAPVWIIALALSVVKILRWKRPARCRKFIEKHRLAFPGILAETVKIQAVAGGVSNGSFIWKCRTEEGEEATYFVKVFLPMGTLWAMLLPVVSPFPRIDSIGVRQRMGADLFARAQLEPHGVAVPACTAADYEDGVTVGEYLWGRMVNDVLADSGRSGLVEDDRLMLWKCGDGLGRIHEAGFSLIDAQPANCMWVPEQREVYFLDMEYCTRRDERNWDLTLFLAFISAQLSGRMESEARELVLRGYWNRRHPVRVPPADNFADLEEYRPVFQAILDIRHSTA